MKSGFYSENVDCALHLAYRELNPEKWIRQQHASADPRHEWRFIKCPITLHYMHINNMHDIDQVLYSRPTVQCIMDLSYSYRLPVMKLVHNNYCIINAQSILYVV